MNGPCGAHNFARRDTCHVCGAPAPEGRIPPPMGHHPAGMGSMGGAAAGAAAPGPMSGAGGEQRMLPGDW